MLVPIARALTAAAAFVLLSGNLAPEFLVFGLAAGIAASALVSAIRYSEDNRLAFRAADVAAVLKRLPAALVRDLAAVLRGALSPRCPSGAFQQVVATMDGTDACSEGRRVLLILGVSFPPASFVTRTRPEGLEVHKLDPTPTRQDPRWPI